MTNELKEIVRSILREVREQDATELSMVKLPRKDALEALRSKWVQLNNHIVKIAMWGDAEYWRTEIKTFATGIQNTKLKLPKSNRHFTREEHEDALEDFRNSTDGRRYFQSKVEELIETMDTPPVRTLEEGRPIAYDLQQAFIKAFIKKQVTWGYVNPLIDSVLNKYPKLTASDT